MNEEEEQDQEQEGCWVLISADVAAAAVISGSGKGMPRQVGMDGRRGAGWLSVVQHRTADVLSQQEPTVKCILRNDFFECEHSAVLPPPLCDPEPAAVPNQCFRCN